MFKLITNLFAANPNKYENKAIQTPRKKGWKQKGHWRKIRGKHVWCGGKEK